MKKYGYYFFLFLGLGLVGISKEALTLIEGQPKRYTRI